MLTLRNFVKDYRLRFGATQQGLAYVCGVSRNTIASIERNQSVPSALLAAGLCEVFDCKFEDLFYIFDDLT